MIRQEASRVQAGAGEDPGIFGQAAFLLVHAMLQSLSERRFDGAGPDMPDLFTNTPMKPSRCGGDGTCGEKKRVAGHGATRRA